MSCIECGEPLREFWAEAGGEPVPEGMREALERGEAVMLNCAPRATKGIFGRCANGHITSFERHEYDFGSRTHSYAGVHKRLPDDFRGLTEPGWPRPRYRLRFQPRVGNYVDQVVPVPWITPVPSFAQTDPRRRRRSRQERLCQICGLGHADNAVVVFLNGGLRAKPDEPRMDLANYRNVILRAIDDAIMHERCAKLAAGVCPKLRAMHAAGDLWAFSGPLAAVEEYEDSEEEISEVAQAAYVGDALPRNRRYYLAMMGREATLHKL